MVSYRKYSFSASFILLTLVGAYGSPPSDKNLSISHDQATDTFTLSWFGRIGQTYFIQQNEDLCSPNWDYIPIIEPGTDTEIEWHFTSNAPQLFFRLRCTNVPTSDPWNDDFDSDGVSNILELTVRRTDPLNPDSGLPGIDDADGDGIGDVWEIANGLDPNNPNDALLDTDGDGITNLQEFLDGTDPNINFQTGGTGSGTPGGGPTHGGFVPIPINEIVEDNEGDAAEGTRTVITEQYMATAGSSSFLLS